MLRETPNLDWLRVFAETAATESFALAATRLNVTPGAVSQRIKALDEGANVNASGALKRTPLFTAAFCDRPEVVKLLLDKGATQKHRLPYCTS